MIASRLINFIALILHHTHNHTVSAVDNDRVAAIFCAICMQMCIIVKSYPETDKIIGLPGQPRVTFQQFSGYITVDEKQPRALFYYFVEAETQPSSKPLVLWLNGGPGCSSIRVGAFIEHSPFKPKGEILIKDAYSKEANMLYLESPAGVGFSYSTNSSFYNSVNDEMTGESYAGHYVPQLAHLIIESKIGNPLLDFSTDLNSPDEYYWSHGLISDSVYNLLTSVCNSSQLLREALRGSISPACSNVNVEASKELSNSIDRYDVTADVCLSSSQSQLKLLDQPLRSRFQLLTPYRSKPEALNQQKTTEKMDVCLQDETDKYLNRKDVQKALHAKLVGVISWSLCSQVLQYDMQELEIPTINVVGSLVRSGIPVFVYSGDQDSLIPLTGTRTLVNGLAKKLGLKTTVPYRVWFEGKQVGGWTQVYGDILSFAIIRGASHTAPSTQPERSLTMFKAFLAAKPLPEA